MKETIHNNDRQNLSYASFQRTKLKGQVFRVLDHLPINEKYARQKNMASKRFLALSKDVQFLNKLL